MIISSCDVGLSLIIVPWGITSSFDTDVKGMVANTAFRAAGGLGRIFIGSSHFVNSWLIENS